MRTATFSIHPAVGAFCAAALGLAACGTAERSSSTSATDAGSTSTNAAGTLAVGSAQTNGEASSTASSSTASSSTASSSTASSSTTSTSASSVGGAGTDTSATGSEGGAGSTGGGTGGEPPDLEWCGEEICVPGAICDESTGFCECGAGYTGDGWWCLSTSPCADSPCLNGGTCHPTIGEGVLCTCPAGFGGVNCEVACSGEIEFPDAAFAEAVRTAASIEAGQPITAEALAGVTSLSISDTPIGDLTGIECMSSLSWVSMYSAGLTDLTPFAALPRLTQLDLPCNSIDDLSPIAALINLTSFSVGKSSSCEVPGQVTDITPLADLVALVTLDLSGHDIESLAPLARVKQLEFLVLASNANLASLDGLEAHSRLGYFVATDTQVSDLSVFADHPTLETLWLSGSQVSDLGPLLTAGSLAELYVVATAVDCQEQADNLAALAANGVTVTSDCE